MRIRYVSLEEAHPENTAIKIAMIKAYRKAVQCGKPVPPVAESARRLILAAKSRHSFY